MADAVGTLFYPFVPTIASAEVDTAVIDDTI